MIRICRTVFIAGAVGVGATVAALAGPIEDRQELMESVGKSMKVAVPMAKGEAPFDASAAKEAMQTINEVPDKFVKLFPEGTQEGGETEASPKIWENMSDFMAKAEALEKASAEAMEAADKGQEAFKTAVFESLAKACKSCHDAYRIKKN